MLVGPVRSRAGLHSWVPAPQPHASTEVGRVGQTSSTPSRQSWRRWSECRRTDFTSVRGSPHFHESVVLELDRNPCVPLNRRLNGFPPPPDLECFHPLFRSPVIRRSEVEPFAAPTSERATSAELAMAALKEASSPRRRSARLIELCSPITPLSGPIVAFVR